MLPRRVLSKESQRVADAPARLLRLNPFALGRNAQACKAESGHGDAPDVSPPFLVGRAVGPRTVSRQARVGVRMFPEKLEAAARQILQEIVIARKRRGLPRGRCQRADSRPSGTLKDLPSRQCICTAVQRMCKSKRASAPAA